MDEETLSLIDSIGLLPMGDLFVLMEVEGLKHGKGGIDVLLPT